MAAKTLLKCGYLLKRQRGRSAKDLRKLKFQQRYIHLDTRTLDYFEGQKGTNLKDSFPVERIRIVENVPEVTFGKAFCFQVSYEVVRLFVGGWRVINLCNCLYNVIRCRLETKRRLCTSEQSLTKIERSGWKLSE